MSSDDCIYLAKKGGLWYAWWGSASVCPTKDDARGVAHTNRECAYDEAVRLDAKYGTEYGVSEVELPELPGEGMTFDKAVRILVESGTDWGDGTKELNEAIEYLRSVCRTT